jgi:GNAT superfamily N-acetyltransferase
MGTSVDVVRLDDVQIPAAAAVLARAFAADPFFEHVLPDAAQRQAALPAIMSVLVAHCQRHGACYTTAGGVQGIAAWNAPGNAITEEQMMAAGFGAAAAQMGAAAVGRLLAVYEYLEALRLRTLPGRHWYLMLLGVEPAHQGQGLGSRLIAPVLAQADADGLPAYLETFVQRDVTFYTHHGFAVLEEGDEPSAGLHYWTMHRLPAAQQNG